jgi:hypothetical protein
MSLTVCNREVSNISLGRNLSAAEPNWSWSAVERMPILREAMGSSDTQYVANEGCSLHSNPCRSTNLLIPVTSCDLYVIMLHDFISRSITDVQQVINLYFCCCNVSTLRMAKNMNSKIIYDLIVAFCLCCLVDAAFTMMIETSASSEILETACDITWCRNSECDYLQRFRRAKDCVLNIVF